MEELFPRLAQPDDAAAVTFGDRTLTYRELAEAAERFASRHHIAPGERIGVWTHPSLDTVVALVGSVLAGAALVPLNPKLGEREREHILGDARPRVPGGEPPVRSAPPIAEADDALLVLYTSGTTGAPKGAVLTRGNVTSNLDALASVWEWEERDRLVHALPLFHAHGLVLGLFGSLRVGSHLIWLQRFSPEAVAGALKEGGTMFFAVPTMYHRLAGAAERDPSIREALGAARLLVSGSAGLPVREHRRLGVPIYERYGLTETLMNCVVPAGGPPQPGLVGPPVPGVEVRLVDEDRRPIEADSDDAVGTIEVRGPNVFAGYLGRPDATREALDEDGWFSTGDLGRRAEDGSYQILGRRSVDLIKTGGFKVGAGEVEACLLEADGVAEAAVVGAPDDDLGQAIVAFIVPRQAARPPEPEGLIQWVADRLTPHKRPRRVEIISELPRNAMGKVQKHRL